MPGTDSTRETVTNRRKSNNGRFVGQKNCPLIVFGRSGAPSAVHAGACTGNAGARARGRVGVRVRGHAGARPPASAPATWAHDRQGVRDWWRCNSGELPHFAFVLRAVLTNAPNSCPSERLFSMFNASFGEDQQRSFGDYLELAMQSQYNKRNV